MFDFGDQGIQWFDRGRRGSTRSRSRSLGSSHRSIHTAAMACEQQPFDTGRDSPDLALRRVEQRLD